MEEVILWGGGCAGRGDPQDWVSGLERQRQERPRVPPSYALVAWVVGRATGWEKEKSVWGHSKGSSLDKLALSSLVELRMVSLVDEGTKAAGREAGAAAVGVAGLGWVEQNTAGREKMLAEAQWSSGVKAGRGGRQTWCGLSLRSEVRGVGREWLTMPDVVAGPKSSFRDWFPGASDGKRVKASACNVGDLSSIPGWGRCPGEENGNPLQYSCLEKPMDGGAS